ncbi:ATP-binding protein [Serratia rubidaea]|nr:ATP-binding protein [Serratia rubidaea]
MSTDLTDIYEGVGAPPPARGQKAQAPTGSMTHEEALADLGPWLEYVDLVVQGLLAWQQQHPEDRFHLAGMLLPPEALAAQRHQPCGQPYWSRQTSAAQWLDGLAPPPVRGRLADVVARFGLTPFEVQVLVLAALPLFDARYTAIFAWLQGDEQALWPGIELALRLFSATPAQRVANRLMLSSRPGALLRHELVCRTGRNGQGAIRSSAPYLRPDEAVYHFLSGEPADTLRIGSDAVAWWGHAPAGAPLSRGAWARCAYDIERLCFHPGGARLPTDLLLLQGGPGSETLVAQLAGESGSPLLVLDLARLPTEVSESRALLRAALRAVRLYAGVLLLREWRAGAARHHEVLRALEPCLAEQAQPVICLVSAGEAAEVFTGLSRLHITLPPRTVQDDVRLLQDAGPATDWDWDWAEMLGRARVDPDALGQLWQEAQGYRALRAPQGSLTQQDLQQALHLRGQQQFGGLAQRVSPRRTFDDLIVDANLQTYLREILAAIRQRETVLARGFSHKVGGATGISALFYGESGTGKSMAAEVLAAALGRDLIRVDLSTVVNKYVGETEKNLAKIFDLAVADTGVLLFDEADALFGKRSEVKDAHDRHANIEVSYLLQRLEHYPGLVVLTSNNRAHLDEAFTRRLTFIARFDAPDAALREQMWRDIWPSQVSVDADVDWAQWSTLTELTGAEIRNVALLASWLAAEENRAVSQADIVRAVRRELGKTGRIMPPGLSA